QAIISKDYNRELLANDRQYSVSIDKLAISQLKIPIVPKDNKFKFRFLAVADNSVGNVEWDIIKYYEDRNLSDYMSSDVYDVTELVRLLNFVQYDAQQKNLNNTWGFYNYKVTLPAPNFSTSTPPPILYFNYESNSDRLQVYYRNKIISRKYVI